MSEYIPRLREELVSAAARERRRAWAFPPLRLAPLVAGALVAAALLAVVLTLGPATDDRAAGSAGLRYRVVPADAAGRSADILRERLAAAGVEEAGVSVAGGELAVDVPAAARATVAALTVPGAFAVYDWERAALDLEPSATRPGTGRAVHDSEGWYELRGRPALGNAQLSDPRADRDPRTGDPIVTLALTPGGQAAFESLTRELARRGVDEARPGDPMASLQHLAIVLDDRLLALPYVDHRENPDGLSGAAGLHISGDLTPQRATEIAAILSSGPLPGTLVPAG